MAEDAPPDAARLLACLAARGLAVQPDDLPAVLAGARRLADAARRLRDNEDATPAPETEP